MTMTTRKLHRQAKLFSAGRRTWTEPSRRLAAARVATDCGARVACHPLPAVTLNPVYVRI